MSTTPTTTHRTTLMKLPDKPKPFVHEKKDFDLLWNTYLKLLTAETFDEAVAGTNLRAERLRNFTHRHGLPLPERHEPRSGSARGKGGFCSEKRATYRGLVLQ